VKSSLLQLTKTTLPSTLTALNLARCKINDFEAKALGDAVGKSASMRSLSLSSNQLTEGGLKPLMEGLSQSKTLTSLCVIRNKLQNTLLPHLAKLLKSLPLSILSFASTGTTFFTIDFLKALAHCPSLTWLDCSDNTLGNVGLATFADYLPSTKLIHLSFSGCDIGVKGVVALAPAIAKTPTLRELKIASGLSSKDKLRFQGCEILLKALKSTSVDSLDVSFQSIRTGEFKNVSPLLADLPSLTYLDISGNHIREEAFGFLSSLFFPSSTAPSNLQYLLLKDVELEESDLVKLYQLAKTNNDKGIKSPVKYFELEWHRYANVKEENANFLALLNAK
jgi:Ran GTPase-activating protein (RanGAP) involved in mRNA processing and transport